MIRVYKIGKDVDETGATVKNKAKTMSITHDNRLRGRNFNSQRHEQKNQERQLLEKDVLLIAVHHIKMNQTHKIAQNKI
jgi:vacuolar-type H+-ATPase subunit B/Vma2